MKKFDFILDGPSFQVLVTKPKKRIKGCKALLDNIPFDIAAQPNTELIQILSRLFLSTKEPAENTIVDVDRKVSGTNMISTHFAIKTLFATSPLVSIFHFPCNIDNGPPTLSRNWTDLMKKEENELKLFDRDDFSLNAIRDQNHASVTQIH
eukprot:TRINITY_DN1138_c0_g3_i10.p1 TRINITY_DN1138_c0_g3~~TRINITY_DN1138_c0_g3_i10.p1  ORF type:complete len:151 (+),score=26.47 TRINITY_DN1138_c0_g3_i10:314-766(+)